MSADGARGFSGRAADALQFALMGALFLFGAAVWLAAGFFAVKLAYFAPAGAEAMGPYPYALAFILPPAALLVSMSSELLARRRRRKFAAAYGEAASGTSMTVVDVDYPLIELGLQPRRGLEYLPEGLRSAPLFADFRGRVEAALAGRLAGYETVLADYWYVTVSGNGRFRSSTTHSMTLAAVRLPSASDASARAPRGELVERLKSAFGSGWRDLGFVDGLGRTSEFDNRWARRSGTTGPAVVGDDWLAFCGDGESASADELRPIIAALAGALSPARG